MPTAYNKITREWTSVENVEDLVTPENWVIDPVFDDAPRGNLLGPNYWTFPGGSNIHVMTDQEIDVHEPFLTAAKLAKREEINNHRASVIYGGFTQVSQFPITGVVTGANGSFDIAGNNAWAFIPGKLLTVSGSTGNNASWPIVSAVYDGSTKTTITVSGNVPDPTADGTISVTTLWNSTPVDIQNLSAVVTLIAAGAITSSVTWTDLDNVGHLMPPAALIMLGAQLAVFGQQCYAVSWTHKYAVDALTTVSAVKNYDYSSGWPA